MKPEPGATPVPDRRRTSVDCLAMTLLMIAADQEVRVLEALAGTLVRRAQRGLAQSQKELVPPPFPGTAAIGDFSCKLQLCRRIARRALRGSLLDPAAGATAFHRVEENPAWAHHLLPTAIIGSFLFYQVSEAEGPLPASATREIPVGIP